MKGTRIIVTSKPRGVFEDVYVTGTPTPGVCMEITPSTNPVGGVFNYSMYGTTAASGDQYVTADGNRKAIAILVEKDDDGSMYNHAYVSGELGRIYWPVMGEQFNMLVADVSGTADDHIIGEEMMLDDGTGKLVTASSPEACPFTLLEAAADPTADAYMWCRYNGSGGA